MSPSAAKRDEAVKAAQHLFRHMGYDDTSIADVVKATGLNRYAIYTGFGGKRELFLAALDDYYQDCKSAFLDLCADATRQPLDVVRALFLRDLDAMCDRDQGCLLCTVAVEAAREDATVAEVCDRYFTEIRMAMAMELTRAKQAGQLHPHTDPEAGSHLLLSVMLGVNAQARAGASRDELIRTVDAAIAALGPNPSEGAAPPAGTTSAHT